jgi:DNA-binding GntR family transcriptional regulator
MPKKYGVKEKDQVVAHIIEMVLTGKLRSGDRIDRNEVARDLGMSRVPIQEALVQLEHDGILSTRYHRGAFVERFDEATVLEHHELYGLLNGIASARAAANPSPQVLRELETAVRSMRNVRDPKPFQELGWAYRDVINNEYAGPRLAAAIRASRSFVPNSFWVTYNKSQQDFLPFYLDETAAISDGDPQAADEACRGRADMMAKVMLGELTRRGVLGSLQTQ